MTPASNFFTKASQAVAVIALAAIFVGLGIWPVSYTHLTLPTILLV